MQFVPSVDSRAVSSGWSGCGAHLKFILIHAKDLFSVFVLFIGILHARVGTDTQCHWKLR